MNYFGFLILVTVKLKLVLLAMGFKGNDVSVISPVGVFTLQSANWFCWVEVQTPSLSINSEGILIFTPLETIKACMQVTENAKESGIANNLELLTGCILLMVQRP